MWVAREQNSISKGQETEDLHHGAWIVDCKCAVLELRFLFFVRPLLCPEVVFYDERP